ILNILIKALECQICTMPLPDYPIPELDVTLQEASRVLQLTLNPDQYQRYETALLQQKDALQEVQEQLKKRISGRENWGTEEFKKQLLSWCDPLPNSNAVPSVLPSSKLKGEFAQIERATALLWAAAKLYNAFTTLRGHRGLYDAWINFTLQLSLRQTLGDAATSLIMVTPTHMRHFKHGR
uniref:Choline/carnitine acyltransferase domain-containing protein n=1 Tax=Cyprinus carpio TaxID=7962 RepID=A0A8C1YLF1_CYPCA